MELLAVKLEKKQNGITEVYAEKKILGSVGAVYTQAPTRRGPRFVLKDPTRPA